jgi:hypothetical protein
MAKTNKIEKYARGPGEEGVAALRGTQSKPAALYLLELRERHVESHAALPKRKLVVSIGHEEGNPNLPRVIRIRHG